MIDTLEVGGAERSLLAILARFRRFSPVMCHIYHGGALRPDYEAAGIPVISLEVDGRYSFPEAIRRFRRVMKEVRPALVHSTLFRADIISRLALLGWDGPLVCSLVNDSYSPERMRRLGKRGRWKLESARLLDALTARRADAFTANSEAVAESSVRALRLRRERVHVIHRGRDPAKYDTFTDEQRVALRARLGLSPDDLVILNTSRHLERKGLREAIVAFRDVVERFPRALLLLAGDGPMRGQLESVAAELKVPDQVRFLGVRNDVPELLQIADLYVFPSHFEGHPGALIEAMMASVPIVTTDIQVHRETVKDGESALLVPIDSPARLAEAMSRLLQDRILATRLRENARRTARERFDVRRVAEKHENLYAGLLDLPVDEPQVPAGERIGLVPSPR